MPQTASSSFSCTTSVSVSPALQQVDDLLEFVLYLVYQKNWIVIILIHLVQQFVIGIKGFHFVSSFLRSSQFRHLPS